MHFLLANEKSLKVRICFMSAVSYFSKLSVLSCRSHKAKSQISSFKICEELSAKQNLQNQQILSLQNSRKVQKKRTVPQRFFSLTNPSFCFFTMGYNDRGYGLGRPAGEFPVAIATKEMRAQRLPEAH